MRHFLITTLVLASVAFSTVAASAATVEVDAYISKGISRKAIDAAVALIIAWGYRCDSVSTMRHFFTGGGYVVICNHYAYEYEIEDRGGNWVVCYDEC